MTIYDYNLKTLAGDYVDLSKYKDWTLLIVNVASKCGLTPQYEGLEQLYRDHVAQGFEILGFPCNQFLEQEPGTSQEILAFCKSTYDVTFPIFEKIEVNGQNRHPIYQELAEIEDSSGESGDIKWNFEKFIIGPNESAKFRFRPQVTPEDPELVQTIKSLLA